MRVCSREYMSRNIQSPRHYTSQFVVWSSSGHGPLQGSGQCNVISTLYSSQACTKTFLKIIIGLPHLVNDVHDTQPRYLPCWRHELAVFIDSDITATSSWDVPHRSHIFPPCLMTTWSCNVHLFTVHTYYALMIFFLNWNDIIIINRMKNSDDI